MKSIFGAIRPNPNKPRLWAGLLFDYQSRRQSNKATNQRYAGTSLPESVCLWNNNEEHLIGGNPVRDQGDTNKCVAYTVCTIGEWQICKEMDVPCVDLEPDCIYQHRENAPDEGMSGDDAFKIAITYGFLSKRDYQALKSIETNIEKAKRARNYSQVEALTNQLRKSAYTLSKQAGVTSTHQDWIASDLDHPAEGKNVIPDKLVLSDGGDKLLTVNNDVAVDLADSPHVFARASSVYDMKRGLAFGNGPLEIIVPVWNMDDPKGRIWRKVPNRHYTQDEDGLGHCMTIIGYSDARNAFLIRNSWGREWGPMKNGHTWYPYQDIEQGMFWEVNVLFIDGRLHLHYIHEKQVLSSASKLLTVSQGKHAILQGKKQNKSGVWDWIQWILNF